MLEHDYNDSLLLALVGELMALVDIEEFRTGLLDALVDVIPAKWISLNDIAPDRVVAVLVRPELAPEWRARFDELAHENPLYRRHVETGDGRAYRFSDVVSREELESTRLFREFYAPLGVMHQIAFTLPSAAGRVLAVALSRAERDFSDAERDFLNRARPYLIQAYRNALVFSGGTPARVVPALEDSGLTRREAEVMRLVALGASNVDAAARLDLSERTVQKHLEHGFRKLGVTTRSQAAARAWELAGGSD